MEYGIRNHEELGTGPGDSPAASVQARWLESLALAGHHPLAYHPQLPWFLSSLQQASYENSALELVHKPRKREPPDDGEEEDEEDRPGDEVENEASEADSWKEAQMPVLSTWMLNAYTTMLSRLSAFSAAYDAAENSDSDSESDRSSYTRSRDSSPASEHPTYIISDETDGPTSKKKKKKRVTSGGKARTPNKESASSESGSTTAQGKKRSLALQRVRYEREEYRCTFCSYTCTIEKAFQRHLRAHARGTVSESQVSCAVCGADRSSEVDLSKHMRRHRDNRYFCCDICIFRTVQLKKLIQHRRMHTGEKPHRCPHCEYRSARRDNLRSHVRRVHKKENLFCDTFNPRSLFVATKFDDVVDEDHEEVAVEVKESPSPQPAVEHSVDQ